MDKKETPAAVPVFDKAAILASERYSGNRDLLAALLKDGESYSLAQVDGVIDKFMKGGA